MNDDLGYKIRKMKIAVRAKLSGFDIVHPQVLRHVACPVLELYSQWLDEFQQTLDPACANKFLDVGWIGTVENVKSLGHDLRELRKMDEEQASLFYLCAAFFIIIIGSGLWKIAEADARYPPGCGGDM